MKIKTKLILKEFYLLFSVVLFCLTICFIESFDKAYQLWVALDILTLDVVIGLLLISKKDLDYIDNNITIEEYEKLEQLKEE